MDIDLAILELGKAANRYKHDGTKITYWDQANTDTQPTSEELVSVEAAADAALAKLRRDHLRANEYPRIGDQLDALFHAGVFPADMAAQLQAVKDKYPKV